MKRIQRAFENKKDGLLSIFITAGYPNLNDTVEVLKELEANGVDMVELGIPFSDPMADGPVIQEASGVAINNGMTLKLLFEQLKDLRKQVNIPVLLMGYLNPVMQYGYEAFCKSCKEVGIDGVILPDLPLYEYEEEYKDLFESHGLANVFLVTPETSVERIQKLDTLTNGFLYLVSSSSTTGKKDGIDGTTDYFKRVQNMKLNSPTLIGFNVKDAASYKTACTYSQGAIIGTAFIRSLNKNNDLKTAIQEFISSIRQEKIENNA
ncbi:MAG: tryptophan synthase subunit alpha [Flavobacteriales bacterium]|nr:tryptophan synthase subunit alpha [Flavobacteriales bacterium]|tara:strand:+ start:10312 stop:11103 length:792 start_codon:yes stop_codon:yes gene_type:complete